MKKIIAATLILGLLCGLWVPAMAAGEGSYTLRILANGSEEARVEVGKELTVSLTMSREGAEEFDLFCMQDYLCFDPTYFTYVDDSLEVYTAGDESQTPVVSAGALRFPAGAGEKNRVYVNRVSDSAQATKSGETILSFRLKAVKTGTTNVEHDAVEVFREPGQLYSVTETPATVTIVKGDSGSSGGGGGGFSGGGSSQPASYTVKATAGEGGSMTPSGNINVTAGGSQSFSIQPNEGYVIADVLVDEKSVGNVDAYTFEKVTADHSIHAEFQAETEDPNTTADVPFTDVSENHWVREHIAYVVQHKLFQGTTAMTFEPETAMTRGMLMTVLARADGADTSGSTPWYGKGMEWAVAEGISDGSDPEGVMTREQMATMLYRYAGSPQTAGDLSAFTDGASVSGWAEDGVRWAVETGILNGLPDGGLHPQDNASRAQVAAVLQRYLEKGEG